MKVLRDLPYAPAHGERGLGDLYLPRIAAGAPLALVIHGGGWQAMDKNGLAGVAALLAERGWAAYAVNYRLLDRAPWPACLDDCLAAARFLLAGPPGLPAECDRSALLAVGASAGGHLALMTGFTLPRAHVRGMVSIAGPTDLALQAWGRPDHRFDAAFWRRFFGTAEPPGEAAFRAASPLHRVPADPPPLLCVHSANDRLVPPGHSARVVGACRARGGRAELISFAGAPPNHGIWADEAAAVRRLLPELEEGIVRFLRTVAAVPGGSP